MFKLEGVLAADPDTVYNFLKISTKQGGKVCRHVHSDLVSGTIRGCSGVGASIRLGGCAKFPFGSRPGPVGQVLIGPIFQINNAPT
jgi:hypothetical protein